MKAQSNNHIPNNTSEEIRVRGTVQGVGFRPTVWKIAQQFDLTGTVSNDGGGVLIQVTGSTSSIDAFIESLKKNPPLLARIDSITRKPVPLSSKATTHFKIVESSHTQVNTGVTGQSGQPRPASDKRV